ncbi:interleukin-6 receptor subunit beta-like [Polymixia lowei]
MRRAVDSSLIVIDTFSCTTTDTSCTMGINSSNVAFTFCIAVAAHAPGGVARSARRCQSGRKEVMLVPVHLRRVEPVRGSPKCLTLTWARPISYAVSEPEVKGGNLTSEIEYFAEGQRGAQIGDVKVTATRFTACLFRPDTLYTVRLRHRFYSDASPWSHWSNTNQGRTAEDAPSAAAAFWRQVKHSDKDGWRHVLLLWKALHHSLANGRVSSYNVTCQRKGVQALNSQGSCGIVDHTRTSCALVLPPERCSCFLTASNSAGTSPEAQIWLLGVSETEPPPPSQITVRPLDDNSLDVRWTAPVDQSLSGFVVEWSAVTEEKSSILHWNRLSSSCKALVITEGVEAMVHYAVSVKALYGERGTGQSRMRHVYTRQGAPSAGPKVEVQEISGNRLELTWSSVPVEKRHGYIRNYTIHYTHVHGHTRGECVPGEVRQYSLRNLLPGNYDIYMQANTDAGTGVAGPTSNVNIGSEDVSLLMLVQCAILPVILMALMLILMVCLAQNQMVKRKLCQDIPDPSNSSLAHWTPQTHLEVTFNP